MAFILLYHGCVMTGYAELDMAIDAIKKGAFDFITKPYNPDYLILAVNNAVKQKKLRELELQYRQVLEETVKKKTEELTDALMKMEGL